MTEMPMTFYLGGKYAEHENLGNRAKELEALGLKLTHDWTSGESKSLSMKDAAREDVRGASECRLHIICLLDPNHPHRGTWTELGVSLGMVHLGIEKTIVVCNETDEEFSDFPFYHHPAVILKKSWEETLSFVSNFVKK